VLSLFGYPGGRRLVLKQLLSMLPPHNVYIEVFGGGAPVLLNKAPSKIEIYNDIDSRLVNMLVQIRDHPDYFSYMIEHTPYSQKIYREYLEKYTYKYNELNDLEKAWITFYLIATSFNGQIGHGLRICLTTNEAYRFHNKSETVKRVARRLRNVIFTCMDYREVFRKWGDKRCLMFLDPPYLVEQKYYVSTWGTAQHIELARWIRRLKCDWILIVNDHPLMYKLYGGYELVEVEAKSLMNKVEVGESRSKLKYLIITPRKYQQTLG